MEKSRQNVKVEVAEEKNSTNKQKELAIIPEFRPLFMWKLQIWAFAGITQ